MNLAAVEAGLLLAWVRIGLRALPFDVLLRGLHHYGRIRTGGRSGPAAGAGAVVRAVEGASRRIPGSSTCLARALTAHAMLSRRGIPAELRIGVRPPGKGDLEAHAWVEAGGQVVIGELDELESYRTLAARGARVRGALADLLRGTGRSWKEVGADPDTVLEIIDREDLVGLVRSALGRVPHDWPAELGGAVAGRSREMIGRELLRSQETARVLAALADAGIPGLLLKGTALAYRVYPHPSERPRQDTDLLIRRDDTAAARRALEQLGYRAPAYSGEDELFRQFEMQLLDPMGVLHAFDLHWRISTQARFADLFQFEELWETAVSVPALGPAARTIGDAEALLLSCVHPAMHHRNEERLIWIYDSHLLAQRLLPADWDRFARLAVTRSVAAICLDGLARSRARFGTVVPDAVLAALEDAARSGEASAEYLAPRREWRHEVASNLRALTWRRRLRLLREIAFPRPEYMREKYGVSGTVVLPALYLRRGLAGVWKVVTGRK